MPSAPRRHERVHRVRSESGQVAGGRRATCGSSRIGRHGQCRLEPGESLPQDARLHRPSRECCRDPQRDLPVAQPHRSLVRGHDVRIAERGTFDRVAERARPDGGGGGDGALAVVPGVAAPRREPIVVGKAGERDGADRLEELEPRLASRIGRYPDERDGFERPERTEDAVVPGDRLGGRLVEPAGEGREEGEHARGRPVDELQGRADDRLEAAVSRLVVGQVEPAVHEPPMNRPGRQHAGPAGGELERQRQPIEAPADLDDRLGVVRVESIETAEVAGSLQEQLRGRGGLDVPGR